MKKIKMFDGIKVTIRKENMNDTTFYPDMTVFEEYNVDNNTSYEIIRALIINYPYEIDLPIIDDDNNEIISSWRLVPDKNPF